MEDTNNNTPTIANDQQDQLSAEEISFSHLVAKGYSYTSAYRKAFPHKNKLAYDTIRRYASDLATKSSIQTEVQTHRETTARLARLAEDRIEDILVNDDSSRKGSKVAEVAMFMYDHANGKATIKAEVKSAHVQVVYDLSGGKAGDVPQEVLDQLAQAQWPLLLVKSSQKK